MSDTTTTTDTVQGMKMVKVKVLGKELANGKRGNCIVNGYICRPGIIRRCPEDKAATLSKLGYVQIEGV